MYIHVSSELILPYCYCITMASTMVALVEHPYSIQNWHCHCKGSIFNTFLHTISHRCLNLTYVVVANVDAPCSPIRPWGLVSLCWPVWRYDRKACCGRTWQSLSHLMMTSTWAMSTWCWSLMPCCTTPWRGKSAGCSLVLNLTAAFGAATEWTLIRSNKTRIPRL